MVNIRSNILSRTRGNPKEAPFKILFIATKSIASFRFQAPNVHCSLRYNTGQAGFPLYGTPRPFSDKVRPPVGSGPYPSFTPIAFLQPIGRDSRYPHFLKENCHQPMRSSRAVDTPIDSFPSQYHHRRTSLVTPLVIQIHFHSSLRKNIYALNMHRHRDP